MKTLAFLLILPVLLMGLAVPPAQAEATGMEQGLKSLIIPGWGQYQNGDFETKSGRVKVGIMAVVEIAAIITTAVVGGVTGAPQVWVGIGLFIGNHVWSALDAFINAKQSPSVNLSTDAPGDKYVAVTR